MANQWPRLRWRAFIPLVLIFFAPIVSFYVMGPIHDALFKWSFPTYEALVRRIETNGIVVSTNAMRIPPEQADVRLCDNVMAQKTSNILVVEFDTDVRGFPAHSTGYIYSSANKIPLGSFAARRITTQIRPNWYYFVY